MGKKENIVEKAIIMAAGTGSRMNPLTLKVPKPLVKVNGKRMIDTVVSALRKNGINEIYVVVGYLKEQFYDWVEKEKGVVLIENPYYETCNNISSLYVARNLIGNCIILDGDQIIYNPAMLEKYFTRSGYNAVWCEGHTDEWLMTVENGVVKSCSRTGGENGWQLYSISRWTEEDGRRLQKHVKEEFESGNRQIYWDDIPMFFKFEEYSLGIKEMKKEDVVEIDSLAELSKIDSSYQMLLENK